MARVVIAAIAFVAVALPAAAQEGDEPRRTRVILGPQLVPRFPGSDGVALRPYVDVSRTRGDRPFAFEAPDESTSVSLYSRDGLTFGPAIGFEGKRRNRDVGGLDAVGFTVELGAAAQYAVSPNLRLFAEGRKGIGGHRGVTGMIGADYVARDGNDWLFSVGPRLTLGDGRYARTYFGVTPREAAATGIPAFRPGGGMTAVGATASAHRQLSDRWGAFGYAKYDRLVGDAADSPVVARFGSRDQLSGGLGLSYTFGRR